MSNVFALERWLDTMRSPIGYGGPVAHWWQQCFMFCGAGFDWRYEGIIIGYLHLWRRTGEKQWLEKACRAGDDLCNAQLVGGHFLNSGFERNPATAGTPHEAACCIGLLHLTQATGNVAYLHCAERNLQAFHIEQLWDSSQQRFRDGTTASDTFVPNKSATICEALFLWAKLQQRSDLVEHYVLPTMQHILDHQVHDRGRLEGAIAQNSLDGQRIDKFIPLYAARCVPALVQAFEWTSEARYLDAATLALTFIERWIQPDGNLPTVIYSDETANPGLCWVAALADILRAGDLLKPHGVNVDFSPLLATLLMGQDASGAFQTARGFAAQSGKRLTTLPDVRDLLHVTGWNDKVFRYLAQHGSLEQSVEKSRLFEADCTFRGQRLRMTESAETLTITARRKTVYHWQKGTEWPEIADPIFWLR